MDNNPIKYSDLIQPDSSINDLIRQLEALIRVYDEAKSKIQSSAEEQRKAIVGLSGATEEQRKSIQLVTEESDKLLRAYRDITKEEWESREKELALAAAKRESAKVDKLVSQVLNSVEGSYNRLSAQYRLNKIRLDQLSATQRATVPEFQKLEKETAAMYEEMKRLQEVTGKHQLNVGNYADAAKGLRAELLSLTQQMAYMKMQGQGNTQEYREMSEKAGQLKDAMADASQEVKNMASDTRQLDTVMAAASAASGGFAAYTGLTTLLGKKDEDAAEAQKKLQAAIAITNGVRAVQNALQKQSSLMVGIRLLQTKAAIVAENLDTAAKGKNIVVTKAATVAQRAFNAAANANPYVLLAVAIITVIGALVAFASASSDAAKQQAELNNALLKGVELNQVAADWNKRVATRDIRAKERELELLEAQGAGTDKLREKENEIAKLRETYIKVQLANNSEYLTSLEENNRALAQQKKNLLEMQTLKAKGKGTVYIEIEGERKKTDIDDAVSYYQSLVDLYGEKVRIGTELETEYEDFRLYWQKLLAQRIKEAKAAEKNEQDIIAASLAVRYNLISDSYQREEKVIRLNYANQIRNLQYRLDTEASLSVKSREALNAQIYALTQKREQELAELRDKYAWKTVEAVRETEDRELELLEEGTQKKARTLALSYQREVEDLQHRLDTERDLTEAQREEINKQIVIAGKAYDKAVADAEKQAAVQRLNYERESIELRLAAVKEGSEEEINLTLESLRKQRDIELAENRALAVELRQDEAAINAKWNAAILRQGTQMRMARAQATLEDAQNLAESEFALLDRNERQKTAFAIAQEKKRLQEILRIDNTLTEAQKQTILNTIAALDKEASRLPYNNLYELLGISLDSQQQAALNTALDSVKDSLGSIIDSWNSAAEAAVKSAEKQVSATKAILDAEIEARNAGYANDVAKADAEYQQAKKRQERAIADQRKAQKAQELIDNATQTSSLITATANLWKAYSGVPLLGKILAIAAIATMWGSFAAAKIKAAQVSGSATEEYGDGTVELLQGGSHASGHDIDLGTKADGTRRRAEGGEYFAVINKRSSRRYRGLIPDVINAFNDGTFADKYARASEAANLSLGVIGGGHTDVSRLEGDVRAIRRQGESSRQTDADGSVVIQYKNLTRRLTN